MISPLRAVRTTRFAVVLGVLAASVALSGCSQVSGVVEQILPERNSAHTLLVGECFNNTVRILTAEDDVVNVPRENCTLEHDNEAIASIELDAEEFPGEDEVALQASEACLPEFEEFIGVSLEEAGTLGYDFFAPSAASWKLGDREVLCYVFDSAAKTAYSLEGKGAERLEAGPTDDAEAGDS